jgi:tRNA G46 methylase TrmB
LLSGEELVQLATAFPTHRIVGMDVAEGMIKEAASLVYSHKLQYVSNLIGVNFV